MPPDDLSARPEPILDLNHAEEQELPFLSLATVPGVEGEEDKVSVLIMESRCQIGGANNKLESMLATGVDGCKQVRKKMENVIREHGAKVMHGRR